MSGPRLGKRQIEFLKELAPCYDRCAEMPVPLSRSGEPTREVRRLVELGLVYCLRRRVDYWSDGRWSSGCVQYEYLVGLTFVGYKRALDIDRVMAALERARKGEVHGRKD